MGMEIEELRTLLENAINSFAGKGRVFSNESQFQFDLAWQLQKDIEDHYDVKLEVLGLPEGNNEKKYYIDLVLVDKTQKNVIPIELKYKTPQKDLTYKNGDKEIGRTFSQGAPDVGSYLFWKDVNRLERLANGDIKLCEYKDYKIKCGFAIFLTNCPSYWNGQNKGLYSEFFPTNDKEVHEQLCAKVYVNKAGKRCKKSESSCMAKVDERNVETYKVRDFNNALIDPIVLNGNYTCKWKSYRLEDCNYGPRSVRVTNKIGDAKNNFFYLMLTVGSQSNPGL